VQVKVVQAAVFRDPDPVLAAGSATVPELQGLQGAGCGVGGERGEPVAVDIVETQLSAGVGPFPADDHPHPVRPAGKVQQAGEVGQVGPLTGLIIVVEGGDPDPGLYFQRCNSDQGGTR